MSFIVFAFHFNRGAYLRNLVHSIERLTDATLVIVDDNSTDPESLEVLQDLSKEYEIVTPPVDTMGEYWTGGLHANMERALALADKRGTELALMVQDDMQIVRQITAQDIDCIRHGFDRPQASFVIHACFLKANRGIRADDGTLYEALPGIYERMQTEENQLAKKMFAYSDTGFFSVPLFRAKAGQLKTGERANEIAFAAKGLRMGLMADPIMHWLPMPASFRAKERRWQDRLADTLAGAGVHPISDITTPQANALRLRDKSLLPYAEDFLNVPTLPRSAYWSLRGGRSNLQARGGVYKILASILPR